MLRAMVRPLLALLLCVLAVLPTTARAAAHFCGDVAVAAVDCGCEHGSQLTDGDDGCCEIREAPDAPPGNSWAPPDLPVLDALPAPPIALPPAPDVHGADEASPPWAPVRGPPRTPIFLKNCALLR